MNNSFSEILDLIKKSNRILLTGHTSPDGDVVGSGLGLLLGLSDLNKELKKEADEKGEIYLDKTIRFILEDKVPDNLNFLKHSILIEELENYDSKYEFDLMICLDSGNYKRIGKVEQLKSLNTVVINIDHHVSNDNFGDYNYVEYISSTSEIIYNFLNEMKIQLNYGISESLYLGLVNDTGNFRHSNTTSEVFKMASNLVKYGIEPSEIVRNFSNTNSMGRLKIMGKVLSDFKFEDNEKLVYYYMSEKDMVEAGVESDDTGGLGELLLSYEKASVSLFLKESGDFIKGSFRSKYDVDVNKLANNFDGGGHKKAAGFKTEKSVEEILEIVINQMKLN
ncbi:MAG: bifunctional oligoribonuclease/PAP phosphatase NrnA [Psychrilyobacter sp.]|nr:bifunctional oligoribonuclease/PAP phosphatase NrnA [Psychrilyobacter sp.]